MIVVDGNDGTGKSTLAAALRELGLLVQDRGMPTKATDDGVPPPAARQPGELYAILDAPAEVCQERLRRAGRSLAERYHTLEDLAY
jgi:thymidylate kinase